MKILIKTIKKMENSLLFLETILYQEYNILLNSHAEIDLLELTAKKEILFNNFFLLSKDRLSLEKKYNVFAPYSHFNVLKNHWNNVVSKCFLLRKLNLKNKILLNKKFYLNQRFLESFDFHKNNITYNINGNLET